VILIKTKKEIDYIRESCKIVAETLQLLKKHIKPGVSTFELDRIAEEYIFSNDANSAFKGYSQGGSLKFPGCICTSINEEVVHGIPSSVRKLQEGDIISLDCGVVKNNYYGDGAISVAVGEISGDKEKLLKITEESLYLGIKEAVVDKRIHDISFAVQQHVESNNFSIVRDLCGHGVGKKLHEEPSIPNFGNKGTGPKLRKGMTLAIEPMVNFGDYNVKVGYDNWTILATDGLPSAHFEHTVLITDGKPEILTIS
jgi:methionyl aminopeptidase